MATCNVCACTDLEPCPLGCSWAVIDDKANVGVCSNCIGYAEFGIRMPWQKEDCMTCGGKAKGQINYQYAPRMMASVRTCEIDRCIERAVIIATMPVPWHKREETPS